MGKHRKNTHYRRIVTAAVAVGAVGIPSAAMACANWPDSGGHRSNSAETSATKDSWNDANWGRPWNANQAGEPSWTASAAQSATKTPSASASGTKPPHAPASAGKTTAPKPKATAPGHTARTTAPKPSTTASPSTRNTTTAASAAPKPSNTQKATPTASGAVARVVELVNAERSKVGCSALTLNTTLSKVAQAHSEDMALHQNMSHFGSDGSSPGDRITSAGYTWSAYGENVAYGYASPEQVMAGWMASPGHKANILNCTFKEIGVGLAQPNSYWTQDFGTAR
ncbi:CAP domain-containing protein [Streptomyces sp. NY05-11A]|uniref:CAP domain-containing protein n=1 Tax=Streptomyces soliscabiei TaxID=588897 RepID=UPI0029A8B9BB|nr:CAP domain-containing protein [Streptomyces sp. NY05-11A]MDX2678369.1 CAP domain-containing protein [Streptomyces sp. NY05-11A]